MFEESYKSLNSAQKEAVDAIEGPVMVIAGPGTGKTTLLTLRIANILKQTDMAPENILALTFTNSGVSAMRNKLIEYIGDDAYRVGIYTFHSFAENIINEFSFYFKHLQTSKVISDLDKVQVLEGIISEGDKKGELKELVYFHDVHAALGQIRSAIDDIKKEGLSPEQYQSLIPVWEKELMEDEGLLYKKDFGKYKKGDMKPAEKMKVEKKIAKAKEIHYVFEKYQEELKKQKFYDFHDMILNVLSELESNENLKLDLQEKYQYLLVDEHQDTNMGQNRIVELLTDAEHLNGRPNLFTVGDEKQSIYRFQGASEETFKHFQDIYTDVQIVNLTENYRSTNGILEPAHNLVLNSLEDAVQLNSNTKGDEKTQFLEFSNYKFELLYLADDIKKKIAEGVDPTEIAVIYRSNKQVVDVKEVFNSKQIPYTILSRDNILNDPNIENLISLIRSINNPNDNHSLGKALFTNFLKLDSYEVINILNQRKNVFECISESKDGGFVELAKKLKQLKTDSENMKFVSFFKHFIEEIGYLEYMISSNDSQDQIMKLDKLFDEIRRQADVVKNYGMTDFIQFIDSYEKYNLDIDASSPEVIDGVKFMTAHKSKGLEFEHVYIIGAVSKNWEKKRGMPKIALPIDDYKGDVHDERRLFYVAMTRAKKGLHILASLTDWEGKEKEKSRFVTEIEEYVDRPDISSFEKDNLNNLHIFLQSTEEVKSIWDVEYLKNLFLSSNFSVTGLNNYIDCPAKYLFRSLIKLPSEYSPSQVFGNLIHQSLDEYFKESQNQKKLLSKDNLLEMFSSAANGSSIYGDDLEKMLAKGNDVLSGYYDAHNNEWLLDIDTEKHLVRELVLSDGTAIKLSGILDKIEYLDSTAEGKVNIVDYKTGKPYSEKTMKSQKEDLDRQIIFYHLLMEGYNEGKFVIEKAVLDFLEQNKKGEFEQKTFDVDDADIEKLKKQIDEISLEIVSGEFLEKGCQKKDCEYCRLLKIKK